jgi:hypothetical protein
MVIVGNKEGVHYYIVGYMPRLVCKHVACFYFFWLATELSYMMPLGTIYYGLYAYILG